MGEQFKSACRMCHGGCGVLVTVEDGKITRIIGDPDSPLNKGRLCPKGPASIEHVYNPDRLKYPLMREGERGGGAWRRVSWDEALDSIAGRLREIRAEHGVESIALGTGTGRHHFHFVPRFANALGTPNWCEPGFAQCFIPRLQVGFFTFGDLPFADYSGDESPSCLLIWGKNPLVSGPDGEVQFPLRDCLKSNPKLIVVDPRLTETSEKADIWLQLRPGTDDALALAMLNVIIDEGLYDREFVEERTVGFDRLAERVEEYPPQWAEGVTWVPAEKIRKAARLFATTSPAALDWGVAFEHTPNSIQSGRAISIIPAITGNIDVPGGWSLGMHNIRIFPYLMENLPWEMKDKRLGADRFKVLSGPASLFPAAHSPTLFRAMRTGEPYPVKAFLIFGNNALVTYANPREVYESLMNLDLLVVMDIYMTPTAEIADIVLPAATWLEIDSVLGAPMLADNVVLATRRIVSMHEARQDEEVLVDLARRLELEVGTESVEEVHDYQLEPLGITFEELKDKGHIAPPLRYGKFEEAGFATASQKIELYSSILENLGYDPLPYYEEPPESPVSTPDLTEEYPLILTTGGRIPFFFHSEHRQIPPLRKKHPDPLVEIHPDAAREAGIEDGDWVWIETVRGRAKQKAKLTEGIDPRVVHAEHGWWFPEKEGPEHGVWESNINLLTSSGPPYDPAMGTYQLRALLCRVYRAD